MSKLKDLLNGALKETLSLHSGPLERWIKETPGAPFGPSIAAGDEFGSYRTSNEAMSALAEIADMLQANDPGVDRTISQDTARLEAATTLGELINELATTGDPDANWGTYSKRLKERLDRRKIRLTHYFPVWLFLGQQASDFEVGPVSFRSPKTWISEVERRRGQRSTWMDGVFAIWAGQRPDVDVSSSAHSVARAIRPDQWVACVTADGFERAESYRRALVAIRAALDTLRLIVPAPGNARICAAVDHGPPTGVDRLSQRDGEDLAHGGSINLRGLSGAPGLAENIIAQSLNLREAAGRRISVPLLAHPAAPCGMLSERWINAMHWYGRGCSDEADFAAVVSYAIALDILSGGLKEKGILELAARLLQTPYSREVVGDGTTLKQLVARIYGYRSEIAHGSILALDERLRVERVQAAELAAAMLITYVFELDKHASSGGSDHRDDFRKALLPVPAGP